MPKLHSVHLWAKYANTHATYEITTIIDVARISEQRSQQFQ